MPPPVELFSSAVFEVGDLVQSIPDTAPGVHPRHSLAITGHIIELKSDGDWFTTYSPRIHLTYIFNLALCEATLVKYSVAWQRTKEVRYRLNL